MAERPESFGTGRIGSGPVNGNESGVHMKVIQVLIVIAGVGVLGGPVGWADETDELFHQLFGVQLAEARATRATEDDVALAGRMVDAAGKLTDAPKLRRKLLAEGYELALRDASGYPAAIDAAAALIEESSDERSAWEEKLIDVYNRDWRHAPRDQRAAKQQALVHAILSVAAMRDARGAWDESLGLYRKALGVLPRSSDQRQTIIERQRIATQRMQLLARAGQLAGQLAAGLDEAAIARELVEIYVVGFNAPGKAAKYAEITGDRDLARRVHLACRPIKKLQADDAYDLAEWYAALAEGADPLSQPTMLERAREGYERFVADSDDQGVRRVKAKLKLAQIAKALAEDEGDGAGVGGGPVGNTIDLLKRVDVDTDRVQGAWMVKNGVLGSVSDEWGSQIRFPVEVDGDYELVVRFRTTNLIRRYAYVYLYLPMGGDRMTWFRISNDYYPPRIGVSSSVRTLVTQIKPGRWHTLVARKQTAPDGSIKLGVAMDGRNIVGWQGSVHAASDGYDAPKRPGVSFNYARAVINKATIKRLSGEITAIDRNAGNRAMPRRTLHEAIE